MKFGASGLVLCLLIAGCGDGVPFNGETDNGTGSGSGTGGGDTGGGITREGLPPGTASPTASQGIFRSEPTNDTDGSGTATNISYDGATDTFTVDGLAFDGDNVYRRGDPVTAVASLGPYAVYESAQTFPDSQSGQPVNQFTHRAIYGVSKNKDAQGDPETQFAIVRTGAYTGYGFGGFIYQRENNVTLPSGDGTQAVFVGTTAGLRDFNGKSGIQYSTGTLTVAVDFGDFNASNSETGFGVSGVLTDRKIYDIDGRDITSAIVNQINAKNTASLTSIPAALFDIGPGVLDANGEALGNVQSSFTDNTGNRVQYETGKYYAIISGDDGQEVVGVMVLENSAELNNVTSRDTSGFIVYRSTP